MRNLKYLFYSLFLIGAGVIVSSFSPAWRPNYGDYEPVMMKRTELASSVSYVATGRDMINPGKIYQWTDAANSKKYIFVNERYKGVHVIDNTDNTAPVKAGFIVVPGCIDIAMKAGVLYLDNAVDLVAFDFATKSVTKRVAGVFPEPMSPEGSRYYGYNPDPENYVIVDWAKRK